MQGQIQENLVSYDMTQMIFAMETVKILNPYLRINVELNFEEFKRITARLSIEVYINNNCN